MLRTLTTAAILAAAVLTGCGGNDADTTVAAALEAAETAEACDAVQRTYEVALEAFYAQYGDSIGNPTGEDLVGRFLEDYNDDYYEIVQGDPSTVHPMEACR
jgi:hypothetical protein